MNSYPKLQVCMKFAYIFIGLIFLFSNWISDNVPSFWWPTICPEYLKDPSLRYKETWYEFDALDEFSADAFAVF